MARRTKTRKCEEAPSEQLEQQEDPPPEKNDKNTQDKKSRRNKSQVELAILEDKKEGESSSLRYYIITCELRHAMSGFQQKQKILRLLNTNAETQGVYRKLTGCLANFVVLHPWAF